MTRRLRRHPRRSDCALCRAQRRSPHIRDPIEPRHLIEIDVFPNQNQRNDHGHDGGDIDDKACVEQISRRHDGVQESVGERFLASGRRQVQDDGGVPCRRHAIVPRQEIASEDLDAVPRSVHVRQTRLAARGARQVGPGRDRVGGRELPAVPDVAGDAPVTLEPGG